MRIFHKVTKLSCLFICLFFISCLYDNRSKIPEPKESYVFPFQTEINALNIYYPKSVEKDVYINSEKCSDELKKSIVETIVPLSNDQLISMGKKIHQEYFSERVTDHERMIWAKEIMDRMRPYLVENQYPYELFALKEDYFNAFTLPGGNIYITTAALDAIRNKHELAFILGHEIGHNENDHTREIGRLIKYGEKLEEEFGLAGSLLNLVTRLFNNSCGKSDELESDLAAFYLVHKAGYDPELALQGFDHLKKFSTPKSNDSWQQLIWIFAGSHPWSEDRYDIALSYVRQSKVKAICEKTFTNRKGKVITKSSPLTLREYPLKHLSGIKIPKGTTVSVICDCIEQDYQKDRDWLYVEYADKESVHYGWVDKKYIEF